MVLEGALRYLQPADRVDLRNLPEENWTAAIRNNLSASTVRQTNLIEVAYNSKDPRAAVAVVNAVLHSYLEFMDKTHKKTANDIVDVLTHEKIQVEQQLQQKEWDCAGSPPAIRKTWASATATRLCSRWCNGRVEPERSA